MRSMKRLSGGGILIPFLLFTILFYFIPLLEIFRMSMSTGGWTEVVTGVAFITFLRFSLTQAILTTVICLLIGIPTGYILAKGDPYLKTILSVMVLVPFLIPPMSILLGFVILYEPNGLISRLVGFQVIDVFGTLGGIVLAHTLYNISIVTRLVAANFETLDEEIVGMAESNGASTVRLWQTVFFPHILPSIFASALLVFLLSFNSFAIVLMLGNVRLQTLEVMIYSQSRIRLDFVTASKIAVLQLLINLAISMTYLRVTATSKYEASYTPKTQSSKLTRVLSTLWISIVILFTWQPIFATVYQLIRTSSGTDILSTQYNNILGTTPTRVLFNTFIFGLITGIASTVLALTIVYYKKFGTNQRIPMILSFISIMPLMSSSITLSLGMLLAYRKTLFFSDTIWIFIAGAHVLAALPFVTQTLGSGAEQIPKDIITISQSLGASKTRTTVDILLPLLLPSIIVSFLLGLAISFGEFGATFFLVRGEWTTVSVAIQKLFVTRDNILPLQYAIILIVITLVSFSLVEKGRR